MGMRSRIALAVVLAGLITGLAYVVLRSQEPMYQGKPFTFWLQASITLDRMGNPQVLARRDEARRAVRRIGPAAAPVLVRLAAAKDTGFREFLLKLQEHLHLIDFHVMRAEDCHDLARLGFAILAREAKPAVPVVLECLQDEDEGVRWQARETLRKIASDEAAKAGIK
jgi:hypothetical protein